MNQKKRVSLRFKMFSQLNNPYCDLLSKCRINIDTFFKSKIKTNKYGNNFRIRFGNKQHWLALVDKENKKILGMGSRVIHMGVKLSKFEQEQAQTNYAVRSLEPIN